MLNQMRVYIQIHQNLSRGFDLDLDLVLFLPGLLLLQGRLSRPNTVPSIKISP